MYSSVRHLNLNTHTHTLQSKRQSIAEQSVVRQPNVIMNMIATLGCSLVRSTHLFIQDNQETSHALIVVRCIFIFVSRAHLKCIIHILSVHFTQCNDVCVRVRPCPRVYIVFNIVWCGIVRMTPDIIYEDDYVIRTMASYEWKANGNERGLHTFYTVFSFLLHFNCMGLCWILEKYGPE